MSHTLMDITFTPHASMTDVSLSWISPFTPHAGMTDVSLSWISPVTPHAGMTDVSHSHGYHLYTSCWHD